MGKGKGAETAAETVVKKARKPRATNPGGRAASGGIRLQVKVAAWCNAYMLAGRRLKLTDEVFLASIDSVTLEGDQAVDDVAIAGGNRTVFFQAKRTLVAGKTTTSEFAKVATQFVKQFRHGVGAKPGERPFATGSDWLIIAVSSDCPKPVAQSLRDALIRRASSSTAALSLDEQAVFNTWTDHLKAAWKAETKVDPTAAELQAIVTVSRVKVFDPEAMNENAPLVLAPILEDPGQDQAAWTTLLDHAFAMSEKGMIADAAKLRDVVGDLHPLLPLFPFQKDVERLRRHSDEVRDLLRRFTRIDAPEGKIAVPRECLAPLHNTALAGSCLLVGPPGAGKSGVLWTLADRLDEAAEVIVLQVDQTANLETLQAKLNLNHAPAEVLANWPGSEPAYLVIDALDAARGGPGEVAYRNLIRAVLGLGERWHVLASVRTFDLHHSRDLQELFRGTPPVAEFSLPGAADVKHFAVPSWSPAELDYLFEQSPTLEAAVVAGGERLADLVLNPFNMSLLGNLLKTDSAPERFAAAASRSDLLKLFWDERIERDDAAAPVALGALVRGMIASGTLQLDRYAVNGTTATSLGGLRERGVVLLEDDLYSFAHHILFDYVVGRTFLASGGSLATKVARHQINSLLIVPALQYWLAIETRRRNPTPVWTELASLIDDDQIDPLVRMELARLGAELISQNYHVGVLAAEAAKVPDGPIAKGVWAFLATQSALQRTAPLASDHLCAWIAFGAALKPQGHLLHAQRNLLLMLRDIATPENALAGYGEIARAVLGAGLADERLAKTFVAVALPEVVKTFQTNSDASRRLIAAVMEPERVARHGHDELDDLGKVAPGLARPASDLTIKIYRTIFSADAVDPQVSQSLGDSQILPLTTTVGQGFDMARYAANQGFAAIIERRPLVAVLSYAATLEGYLERKSSDRKTSTSARRDPLSCGQPSRLEPDGSATRALFIDSQYSEVRIILRAAEGAITGAAPRRAQRLCRFVLETSGSNLVVRRIFRLAAARAGSVGEALLDYALRPEVLSCLDTREAALALLRAVYLSRDASRRLELDAQMIGLIDTDLLAWVEAPPPSPDPSPSPSSERRRILSPGRSAEELASTEPYRPLHDLAHQRGVKVEDGIGNDLLTATEELLDQVNIANKSENDVRVLEQAAERLWGDLDAARDGLPPGLGDIVEFEVARASQALASSPHLTVDGLTPLRPMLLALIAKVGVSDEEQEARYEGTGSQQTAATVALASLLDGLDRPGMWAPDLVPLLQALCEPTAPPAARGFVVNRLAEIAAHDLDLAIGIANQTVGGEANLAVLDDFVDGLPDLMRLQPSQGLTWLQAAMPKLNEIDERTATAIAQVLVERGLAGGDAAALALINAQLDTAPDQAELVGKILYATRPAVVFRGKDGKPDLAVRTRALALISRLFDAIRPAFDELYVQGREPKDTDRKVHTLFKSIYDQLYFAVGAFRTEADGYTDPLPMPMPMPMPEEKREFLALFKPLLEKMAQTGDPGMVHHLLQLLTHFAPAAPETVFDLSADVILRSGTRGYQFEQLGLAQVVELVGLLLSDHSELFRDEGRRNRLSDCLSLFADAGWPEARLLMLELPSVLG